MMIHPRLVIAGTHSGVGKTTVALALMAALRKRGLKVQAFKVGPDYIDPSHHSIATEIPSRNLDTWMMGKESCLELFVRSAARADISIIEGVMGLYDGHRDGAGSTAELSKLLRAPVILVLDARGLARSAAAMLLGYKNFDPEVHLCGVFLNNVATENHFELLKRSTEEYTHLPVLGCLFRDREVSLPSRHLGLVPSSEGAVGRDFYTGLADRLAHLDANRLLEIAHSAREISAPQIKIFSPHGETFHIRIALARDEAFHFYYEDNLDLLRHLGAEIIPFSPLRDTTLPDNTDLIYIGGGFPELYARRLEENHAVRKEIRLAADRGLVIYGECGGMMYLLERLVDFEGRSYNMSGVLAGTSQMNKSRQALGYITVRARCDNLISKKGEDFRGHVFHWSSLLDIPEGTTFAYEVTKGGETRQDGFCKDNILASYVHVHFACNPSLALNLLSAARGTRV